MNCDTLSVEDTIFSHYRHLKSDVRIMVSILHACHLIDTARIYHNCSIATLAHDPICRINVHACQTISLDNGRTVQV